MLTGGWLLLADGSYSSPRPVTRALAGRVLPRS